MRTGRVVAGLGLLGLLWAAGCDEEGTPNAPPPVEEDGSTEDAGPEDDAGDDADAGTAEEDAGELSQCEGDVLEYPAANAPGRSFSASLNGNRADLVYLVASGGSTLGSSKAQGLRRVSFDTTGEAGEPEDVVNVGIDSYWKTRDPALVAHGDALELFFTSNQAGSFELFRQDLSGGGAAEQQTSNVGRNEFASAGAGFGEGVAVAYSDELPQIDAPGAIALKLPGAAAQELVPASLGLRAARLAFAAVGASASLAFVSDLEDGAGIYLQGVSAAGEAQGDLQTLSEQIGGASDVDIAKGRLGSALVYTVAPGGGNHQLRFRRIGDDGRASDTVRALTSGNQNLLDIALASYSQGYVVAYRRLGGPAGAAASIYLLFADSDGNVGGTRMVRSASATGRGVDVMVGNDGRLIVIWSDTEQVTNPDTQRSETELRVRVARLLCAL